MQTHTPQGLRMQFCRRCNYHNACRVSPSLSPGEIPAQQFDSSRCGTDRQTDTTANSAAAAAAAYRFILAKVEAVMPIRAQVAIVATS